MVGAIILGLGRALGETMAVTMVIGNGYNLMLHYFHPVPPSPAKSPVNSAEAASNIFISSLVELALVLFAVTLLVNVVARMLVWRLTAVKAEKE